MYKKKTTLPYLRNQDWRAVKSKTKKVNDLLTTKTRITDKKKNYDKQEY